MCKIFPISGSNVSDYSNSFCTLPFLFLSASLSVWGDADEAGCPDKSDVIKDMKDDTSTDPCQGANYKSPRGYSYTVTDWFPCNKAAKGDIVKRNVNKQQKHENLLLFLQLKDGN